MAESTTGRESRPTVGNRVGVAAEPLDRAQFCSLAETNAVQHASAGETERLLCWIAAWFRINPDAAWTFIRELILSRCLIGLETLKAGLDPNCWFIMVKSMDKFVLELANALKEPYLLLPREPVSLEVSPTTLREMILLLNLQIRPREDAWHETAYTPGLRDNAQDYRNALPHQLAGITSDAAHQALLELADDLPESRDRFLYLADQNLGLAAESRLWKATDPSVFAASFEREPTTADELFQIALDRLDDLRWEIEAGDFSERGLFKPNMREEYVQKWVAARLDGTSRGKYSVHREEEVDNYKEPDLRLHHPEAGRVGIEIKPTDRYSFSQLDDALKKECKGQVAQRLLRSAWLMTYRQSFRQLPPGCTQGADSIQIFLLCLTC